MPVVSKLKRYLPITTPQAQYLSSDHPYRAFVGGRGAGKSWIGSYDLLKRCRPGCTYLVAAPTYQMLRDASLSTFKRLCETLGIDYTLYKADMMAVMQNGAEIRFRSADNPDRLRGPNLSGAWLDEASLMSQDAYEIVMASLREHGVQGWLGATFTPKGLSHWTYELFNQERPDTELIRSRTADNPFLPPDFAETLRRQYTDQFALQELEGMFVSIEGAEWPPDYFDHAQFWFDEWPVNLAVKTMALDPSKGREDKAGDYSAYVLYGRDASGIEYVEADLRRRDAEQIVDDGVEHLKRFGPDAFGVESNAFQHLFAPLFRAAVAKQRIPLPLVLLNNVVKKIVRIRRITEPLRMKKMRFRNTPGTRLLVQQLREFPLGEYDDGPDGLEMARRIAIELHNTKPMRGRR